MQKYKLESIKCHEATQELLRGQLFKIDEPELLILKAHSIIEALLFATLEKRLPNPGALSGARLTFKDTLCITKSTFPPKEHDGLWETINKLNKLRNEISHHWEVVSLKDRIKELINNSSNFITVENIPENQKFRFFLLILCTVTSNIKEASNHTLEADG